MSSAVTRCRSVWTGGAPMLAPPPLNPAPATWSVSTNVPATAGSYSVNSPVVYAAGTLYVPAETAEPNGAVLVSSDNGASWAAESVPSTYSSPFCLADFGGRVLAFCEDYAYTRGNPWTPYNSTKFYVSGLAFAGSYAKAAYGDGIGLFFVGTGTGYARSTDGGVNWTLQALPESQVQTGGRTLIYDGEQFVSLLNTSGGVDDQLITSPDGITWVQQPFAHTAAGFNSLTYGGGLYIASNGSQVWVGDSIAALAAAVPISPVLSKTITSSAALEDGRLMVMCSDGTIYSSPNAGASWIEDTIDWTDTVGGTLAPVSPLPGAEAFAAAELASGDGAFAVRLELC